MHIPCMLEERVCGVHGLCTEFYDSQMNKRYVSGVSKIFLKFKIYFYPILRTQYFFLHPRVPPFVFGLSVRTVLVEVGGKFKVRDF